MQPSAPPEAMTIHVSIDFSDSDRIEVGRPGRGLLRLAPVGVIGRPVGAAVQVDSTTKKIRLYPAYTASLGIEGAAGSPLPDLDGRAAILMVARPGGCVGSHSFSAHVSATSPITEVGQCYCRGGLVLLKAACLLLIAWLLGIVGVYDVGSLVHVLLLVGLMLLLLGMLKARDAAARRRNDSSAGEK